MCFAMSLCLNSNTDEDVVDDSRSRLFVKVVLTRSLVQQARLHDNRQACSPPREGHVLAMIDVVIE